MAKLGNLGKINIFKKSISLGRKHRFLKIRYFGSSQNKPISYDLKVGYAEEGGLIENTVFVNFSLSAKFNRFFIILGGGQK